MQEGIRQAGEVTFTNPLGLHLDALRLFVTHLSPSPPHKVFCKLLKTEMALTPSFFIALSSELVLSGEKRMGKL